MSIKPKVYLTSNVFSPKEIGSNEKISQNIKDQILFAWEKLKTISELEVFNGRFPSESDLRKDLQLFKPNIIGCHLSHLISSSYLKDSELFAISTSTAGYNHIERSEKDDILITHTPSILHKTVADYTIALIMANLRNLIDLHFYVWNNKWPQKDKWDLDQNLSSMVNRKIIGIVGLGEIGKELVKRLYPWGLKIFYYDTKRMDKFEKSFPNIEFKENLEEIFRETDIITLHIPLNKYTKKIINRNLLTLMKKNALLINTARGSIIDLEVLLELLENRKIQINFALDVFPIEPIDFSTLKRLKKIKKNRPEIRIIIMPHNASADADTRGNMDILFLKDIIKTIESNNLEDLKTINLIPEHKKILSAKKWRIYNYWKKKGRNYD